MIGNEKKRLNWIVPIWLTTSHSIKSSSANVGALQLSKKCREMEVLGEQGDVDAVKEMMEEISDEFVAVRSALLDELAGVEQTTV
ncbi:MAG: hypothetical protein DIZ77_02010 [endosymbiont of Seepiophila jonesi]|uniref:HPt domain-containing protein n=1 Tax=endosymbiont of Lamellibrachia luymesi TaxID=2200907 RepID=A0A370DXZ5_9GAMM|nr:MAG: hypothetical protein DIZ79_09090 [endosymbiont of Lamellibrachia luymesi]RDH94280.1 MAG: hypothetical protein DIZ77_02010 [endosymbiont of Seepiophila jonesi]